jgi:hypothetical protein
MYLSVKQINYALGINCVVLSIVSSLHFVSLKMTDACGSWEGMAGGFAASHALHQFTYKIVILSVAKNLIQ